MIRPHGINSSAYGAYGFLFNWPLSDINRGVYLLDLIDWWS